MARKNNLKNPKPRVLVSDHSSHSHVSTAFTWDSKQDHSIS
uniref:Uncharacterized protein n=1 Tax=Anguilla anguilla TaxID=7936 RepID=A0A0E9TZC5_ANGAN